MGAQAGRKSQAYSQLLFGRGARGRGASLREAASPPSLPASPPESHSPACFTPRISSSLAVRPTPRSISTVAAQRLDGVDAHAAHHFLDLVCPCRYQVDEALTAHRRDQDAAPARGTCVAMPQLQRPGLTQRRTRWQPSAIKARRCQCIPRPPPAQSPSPHPRCERMQPPTHQTHLGRERPPRRRRRVHRS